MFPWRNIGPTSRSTIPRIVRHRSIVVPRVSGAHMNITGRPPTLKKPGESWLYLQMVKQHDSQGHFTGTKLKAVYGELNELIKLLGESTAYIERDNLTSRLFNARQNRKTLAFSKKLENHRASAIWEDGCRACRDTPTTTSSSFTKVCACLPQVFPVANGYNALP